MIRFDQLELRSGDCGISVETVLLAQVRSNSRFDPICVPSEYQIAVESGKNGNAGVYPLDLLTPKPKLKTELDFDQWLLNIPASQRPSVDSYKLWFGGAPVVPLKDFRNKTDKSRLLIAIPTLGDLERPDMLVRVAERKQLYETVERYLRQRAPELFQHTNSVGGPADLRPRCARCGGNYSRNRKFSCAGCGGRHGMRQKGFDIDSENALLAKKLGADTVIRVPEVAPIDVATDKIRQQIATILITSKHKGNIVARFGLLFDYQTVQEPAWTLKDYADKYEIPEETAKTQIRRFRKEVAKYGGPLLKLNDDTRRLAARVLGVRGDLNPHKVVTYGGTIPQESEAVCID